MDRRVVTAEKLAGSFSVSLSRNVENSGISNLRLRLPTVVHAAKHISRV